MNLDELEITDELAKQLEESISELMKQREAKLLESVESVIAEKLTPQMQVKFMALVEEKESEMKAKLSSQLKSLQESHKKELQKLAEEKDAEIQELKESIESYSNYVIEEHEQEIQALKESAESYGEYVLKESTKKIDTYLDYVVENFIKENQEKLVENSEYIKMKRIFEGFRQTFSGAAYELDGSPLLDEMKTKLEEHNEMYNKLNNDYVQLKTNYDKVKRKLVQEEVLDKYNLSDAQKERVITLAEKVNFNSIGEFETGLTMIIEEVSSNKEKITKSVENQINNLLINESVPVRQTQPVNDDIMQRYIMECERLTPYKI
ncbi:MAG: hypothetical protein PHC28_08960 [Flavobacterium sp.]|uniref:hypothetical protein n=1 Tax=Flavobacterium sp. TaxID=239 RepID=UPI00261AD89B|nr:hypothetical protein [Flavobacterium sp.]MDD5150598.1 hypothetical protein [Flavobacterium sp.]